MADRDIHVLNLHRLREDEPPAQGAGGEEGEQEFQVAIDRTEHLIYCVRARTPYEAQQLALSGTQDPIEHDITSQNIIVVDRDFNLMEVEVPDDAGEVKESQFKTGPLPEGPPHIDLSIPEPHFGTE